MSRVSPDGKQLIIDNEVGETENIEANLDGIGKTVGPLRPVVKPVDPVLADKIDTTFSATLGEVAKLKAGTGPSSSASVDAAQRKEFAAAFTNLAEALNQLPAAIGINANGT